MLQSQSSSGTSSDPDSNSANIKARLLFPNLSVLDVSNNIITVIPAEICEMSSLSEFKMKENRVKEVSLLVVHNFYFNFIAKFVRLKLIFSRQVLLICVKAINSI